MFIEISTKSNFIVETIIPLITCIVLVATSIGGFLKYWQIKHKERNEKIVNEVYLPFIEYLVKQELFRKIKLKEFCDYKKTPILSITTKKKSNISILKQELKALKRKKFYRWLI